LQEKHARLRAEDMIKEGALGIGEANTPFALAFFIRRVVTEQTGIEITSEEATAIAKALSDKSPDEKTAKALMDKKKVSAAMDSVKEIISLSENRKQQAVEACWELVKTAKNLGVTFQMHNDPNTASLVRDFAKELGGLLIALHSNLGFKPHEAIELAKSVKDAGGWIEIIPGDYFGSRQHTRNHANALALLQEGLVDIISTDVVGLHWSPILRMIEYIVQQGVVDLPQAIAMGTGNVLRAFPKAGPNRGQIAEGKIADLLIMKPGGISDIRTVIIGGGIVAEDGKIVTQSEY